VPPANVSVTLGGIPQQVLYVGSPSETPGIDQINFRVAPNTPLGCYVPLNVTWGVGNTISAFLSVSADGSPCRHPFHLSQSDLKALDNGAGIDVTTVGISSVLTVAASDHAGRQESAAAFAFSWSASDIASQFRPGAPQGCSLSPSTSASATLSSGAPRITLTNGSEQITLDQWIRFAQTSPDSSLANLPPAFFIPGQWTLTVPQTNSTLTFPLHAPGMLSSPDIPIKLSIAADQTISWNGSALDPQAQATLILRSVDGVLYCTAPASAGSVVIPQQLLAKIKPGSASISLQINQPYATSPNLSVTESGGSTEIIVVNQTSSDTRPAVLQ
jgi:hypothetical protein